MSSGDGRGLRGFFDVMNHGRDDAGSFLDGFHPAVSSWFRATFGEPTLAQRLGWPAIGSGENCLIVAPTGSGKTLAAFLAALTISGKRRVPIPASEFFTFRLSRR